MPVCVGGVLVGSRGGGGEEKGRGKTNEGPVEEIWVPAYGLLEAVFAVLEQRREVVVVVVFAEVVQRLEVLQLHEVVVATAHMSWLASG